MEPILLNIPTSLETERVHLRKPFPGDGDDIYDGILASQDQLKPWFNWAIEEFSLTKAETNVRKAHVDFLARKNFLFHLYEKENNVFIGTVELHPINWEIPAFSMNYWIHLDYQQQGYATECVYAISYFAFHILQAKRLEIHCDSINSNGRHVAEKTGFYLEGILYNNALSIDEKELRHTCIYGKIAPLADEINIESLDKDEHEEKTDPS